ncbi:ATP-dependent helicase [Chthonobacter albigriseus]|uniref:ATP-dependent helicase n=1 Tax=Chthonobacter albigriseus TaxID=1683161 RepID=UPI001FCEFA84|nr:UvrD-helicase domain-containing protein [Chthonobacter albigriseus]
MKNQPGPTGDEPEDRPSAGIAARAMAAAAPRPGGYLQGMNPEQREAVEALDGPVLVLAGAGTGKTRVLTTRIAHILATRRAFPSEILSVTFTNKAAREMKERIGKLVGGTVEGMPWLGTFHSIGVKMLRRHAELAGLRSDFTILDTDDQLRLMKQLIVAEGIDEKRWPARQLASAIDGWKNKGLRPHEIPEGEARAYVNGMGRKLYADYQARLKVLNACDFGDLLLETLSVLRDNPDVLAEYHRRFKFILVDEYQDTNVVQYLWLRLLAQGSRNICCVGDDDQSIYGWRGAEVDNILRYERDFPGAKVIRLERNYRSTSHILAAASHLIAHNEARLGKTLFTDADGDPDDPKVRVASAWDSEEEARSIGEEIERFQRKGTGLDDIAILVRASFQMREFEERFITMGLPYRVIGGPRFYERQEIRDALAYLRIVSQLGDDLAFERIINTPRRGIGDTTVRVLHEYARANQVPLTQALRELIATEEFKGKTRLALRDFIDSVDRWRGQLDAMKHTDLAELILEESGYTEMWQNDRSADAPGRLENLKELIRAMDGFDTMGGFLEHISLVMDRDAADGNEEKVSVMTLHSAKGLEFDTVFLPGWEEGLFPHQRALDEGGRSGLEEERRLAYVGITRAKKRCLIWFAANRRIHGSWQSSLPSRFLDELPEAHVEVQESQSNYGGYNSYVAGYGAGKDDYTAAGKRNPYGASRFDQVETFKSSYETPGWQRAQRNKSGHGGFSSPSQSYSARGGPRVIEGELIAKSIVSEAKFATGERVFHVKFGYGTVAVVDGNKLTVDFDKAGQKRVVDSFLERK